MSKKLLAVLIATILVLTLATTVFAEDEVPAIPACEGDEVSGTIVAYDADLNVVTLETEPDVFCTVALSSGDQDYGHPITTLLGNYFNNMTSESLNLEETLAAKEVCLNQVADTDPVEYELFVPAEGEECPFTGTVLSENEDGTFQVALGGSAEGEDPEVITLAVEDPDAAEALAGSLEGLLVDWTLNEDGSMQDAGDVIGALHDDGVGFGVIVKLYGIADASGVSVEELIAEYQAGASIGELFAKYGKPSLLGVGHVRKDAANSTADENLPEDGEMVEGVEADSTKDKTKDNTGICNARANGGKAKANGHGDVDCGDGN